jgi:hypothetical protein
MNPYGEYLKWVSRLYRVFFQKSYPKEQARKN